MATPQLILGQAPQMKRKLRRPQHRFQLKTIPWALQPFMIAPVLPGETLKNLLLQVRAVTDPVKNPLVGWWKEYYFFYVKHRDLYERAELTNMVLDPAWSPTNVTTAQGGTAAEVANYYAGGAGMINWTKLCTRRVIDEYFRDEGQSYANNVIAEGGYNFPIVSMDGNSWLDSATVDATMIAQDVDVDGPDANTTIQASEVELAMRKWEMLRMNNMTQMSYEDFLATYGIRTEQQEMHRPELIRYVRDWTYPSNTIDPTSGAARSALSWVIAERADKDRFFSEPGFILGLTCARPKVYLRNQVGSGAEAMNDLYTWLPALLSNDPRASFKKVADAVGPLGGISSDLGGWWFDVKDLLMYGDQFTNVSTAATDMNFIPAPDATLTASGKRYVSTLAAIQELFVTGASAYYVREDGIASLQIASSVRDTSPRGGPADAV